MLYGELYASPKHLIAVATQLQAGPMAAAFCASASFAAFRLMAVPLV